ncbi:hypothetical protein ACFQFQ_21670 [Sulfitobacter porphyrae]|uniref:Uncharacterized protein n=1 Tax=Sulfitobacter porphyrae TaxID=1246864 RepID=A0ABW2B6T6_9RHOB
MRKGLEKFGTFDFHAVIDLSNLPEEGFNVTKILRRAVRQDAGGPHCRRVQYASGLFPNFVRSETENVALDIVLEMKTVHHPGGDEKNVRLCGCAGRIFDTERHLVCVEQEYLRQAPVPVKSDCPIMLTAAFPNSFVMDRVGIAAGKQLTIQFIAWNGSSGHAETCH